jgi:hypothetical protein
VFPDLSLLLLHCLINSLLLVFMVPFRLCPPCHEIDTLLRFEEDAVSSVVALTAEPFFAWVR